MFFWFLFNWFAKPERRICHSRVPELFLHGHFVEPFLFRGPGVALHFSQGLVACDGHDLVRAASRFCESSRGGFT